MNELELATEAYVQLYHYCNKNMTSEAMVTFKLELLIKAGGDICTISAGGFELYTTENSLDMWCEHTKKSVNYTIFDYCLFHLEKLRQEMLRINLWQEESTEWKE